MISKTVGFIPALKHGAFSLVLRKPDSQLPHIVEGKDRRDRAADAAPVADVLGSEDVDHEADQGIGLESKTERPGRQASRLRVAISSHRLYTREYLD